MLVTRQLRRNAIAVSRHPLSWVAATICVAIVVVGVADMHLRAEEKEDRQLTAFINLMYQPGGATIPMKLGEGVEMLATVPKPMFDQLFNRPEDMCSMIGCEKAFGSALDVQTIVTLATAVRDVRLRREVANTSFWTGLMATLSLVISLITFAVATLRPAVWPKKTS